MESPLISNPVPRSERTRESRRKRKKIKPQSRDNNQNPFASPNLSWKSEKTQQVYSSKLLQALRKVRLNPTSSSAPRRGRAVREAADRVLAVAARGRTRWSRALLTSRLKIKFIKNKRQRVRSAAESSSSRLSRKPKLGILRLKGKNNLPAVHRKVRVLGKLVPGCRKEPFPVILEEVTDYIEALQMQIRAMTAITERLSQPSAGATSSTDMIVDESGGSGQPPPS